MAGLEDQGQYNCHIFEEQTDAEIYTSTVMLEVIGKHLDKQIKKISLHSSVYGIGNICTPLKHIIVASTLGQCRKRKYAMRVHLDHDINPSSLR